ncbi:hypothetical protein UFOVP124_34 [uncultured Caudovirales phage]|uniref:Uncharacterized protein n=1 Tax=uncultured Caudovirales phage TaxID=2100421 RepID=A0A6J5LCC5_9CAUD|nr:hypothetical protein UFOVP124_34 [uncultured Caudovirales phage]
MSSFIIATSRRCTACGSAHEGWLPCENGPHGLSPKPKRPKPVILFIGPSGCGKDYACRYLAEKTGLIFWGSLSWVIAHEIAEQDGISPLDAMQHRHASRERWRATGDAMRQSDPAFLVQTCLDHGANLLNGCRARIEFDVIRSRKLADLVIWIDRNGMKTDPTLELTSDDADMIMNNDEQFNARLDSLISFVKAMA